MVNKSITVLGVETSCDDTGIGLVREGKLLAHRVFQQMEHSRYGGVIPELASRTHLRVISNMIEQLVEEAGVEWEEISAVGVTRGPGLMGALLVGYATASALALSLSIPLIAVNHLESHLFAGFFKFPPPQYPLIGLIASGGHTELVYSKEFGHYELLGRTRDDAAGEVLDKIGRLMGLPYPAGQQMDEIAQRGDPKAFHFPVAQVGTYEFSFSGVKTYAARLLDKISSAHYPDFLASYICAVVRPLVEKSLYSAERKKAKSLILAGGVARNSFFRALLSTAQVPYRIFLPPPELCSDNGAMVALNAYYAYLHHHYPSSPLPVDPSLDFLPAKRRK